jgi:hypothetical protein
MWGRGLATLLLLLQLAAAVRSGGALGGLGRVRWVGSGSRAVLRLGLKESG